MAVTENIIPPALELLERDYYRPSEASEKLGMSRAGFSNWVTRGRISPDFQIGSGRMAVSFFERGKIDRLAEALAGLNA